MWSRTKPRQLIVAAICSKRDEADLLAMGSAPKTVVEALILDHVKRRRLFGRERAQRDESAAAGRERAPPANQRCQRDPSAQLVERDQHRRQSSRPSGCVWRTSMMTFWLSSPASARLCHS